MDTFVFGQHLLLRGVSYVLVIHTIHGDFAEVMVHDDIRDMIVICDDTNLFVLLFYL